MRRPVLVALLVLVGCASTKVLSTWSNPALPARKIQSFAVFASTGYPTGRIEFEQQLTDALRRRGLDATPGYNFVAYDEYPGRDEILRRVQAKGPAPGGKDQVASRPVRELAAPGGRVVDLAGDVVGGGQA